VDAGKPLSELTRQELAAHSELLAGREPEFREVLQRSSWLESKISQGGTALARVREQVTAAREALDQTAGA
jgi:argininosuccinate lyase